MHIVSLVEFPPSLHTRGNAFRLTGRLLVIRLMQTLSLPVVLPPQSVRYRQVMGVGTEGQVWAGVGGSQARDKAGKGEEALARLPVVPRMACYLPSTFESQTCPPRAKHS